MPRASSSLSWIADRYSRLQGSITRYTERIDKINQRLEFHRSHIAQYERHLLRLELSLARARLRLPAMERALRLHEHAADPEGITAVRPHEGPRPPRYGEMTRWIYGTLRAAPGGICSIDQLHAGWMNHIGAAKDLSPHLLCRLQTRLSVLLAAGKLEALDPPRAPGRRWRLSADPPSSPSQPQARRRRSLRLHRGSALPALWLIRTQQELRSLLRRTPPSDRKTRSQLVRNLRAVERAWAAHPMWFPIDPDRLPADTPYRREVRRQVIARLSTTRWMTLDALYAEEPRMTARGRHVAVDAIRKALKHLVLEGRAVHRRLRSDLQVEWRLSDTLSVDQDLGADAAAGVVATQPT